MLTLGISSLRLKDYNFRFVIQNYQNKYSNFERLWNTHELVYWPKRNDINLYLVFSLYLYAKNDYIWSSLSWPINTKNRVVSDSDFQSKLLIFLVLLKLSRFCPEFGCFSGKIWVAALPIGFRWIWIYNVAALHFKVKVTPILL